MTRKKVLILEDESLIALALKKQLEKHNFDVVGCVSNIESAEVVLRNNQIDIALLDINIAGSQDGISLGQRIQNEFLIPFIYLTAYSNPSTVEMAKRTNPYGYITKPIRESQLFSAIEMAFHRKELEEELIEKQKREKDLLKQIAVTEKLDSISKLVIGLAHDINNSLFAAMGNVEMVMRDLSSDPKNQNKLQSAIDCCSHSATLIKQMLGTTRAQEEYEIIRAGAFIKQVIGFLKPTIRENIALNINADDSLFPIKIIRSQIMQVIINIVNNAQDAILHACEGEINISFDHKHVHDSIVFNKNSKTNFYTTICFKDNGHGIDEGHINKIFDPFFSTKSTGNSYGLGLFSSYQIMQSHGGWIGVESFPHEGSEFVLYFPQQNVFNLEK